jgi:hypothetical protein
VRPNPRSTSQSSRRGAPLAWPLIL